jgi:hypothetical protein
MNITRTNYETYIIDYLDRNLSPLEVAELLLFLEQNPDIKYEFEGIEEISLLNATDEKFNFKHKLKRPDITPKNTPFQNYQDLLIGKMENDLTPNETYQLDTLLLQNPLLKKELECFNKTKLEADFSIYFKHKNHLKRKNKVIPLFYRWSAAAAIVTGIIVFSFIFSNYKNQSKELASSIQKAIPEAKLKTEKHGQSIVLEKNVLPLSNAKKAITKQLNPEKLKLDSFSSSNQVADLAKDSMISITPLMAQEVKTELKVNPGIDFIIDQQEADLVEPNPKDFLSLKEVIAKKIKHSSKSNLDEKTEIKPEPLKSKLSGWDLAAFCANKLAKLSGKKLRIENKYNAEGELVQYAIVSNNFEFSKSR